MKKPNFSDSSFPNELRLTVLIAEILSKTNVNIELDICPSLEGLLDPRLLK
jgi:hypothetical protein